MAVIEEKRRLNSSKPAQLVYHSAMPGGIAPGR